MTSYISSYTDRSRDTVIVWERTNDGERVEQHYAAPYYFYVSDENGTYQSIYGDNVRKEVYDTGREYYAARKRYMEEGIVTWESDISPELRVLSNNYFNLPAPKLHVTFYDIEVDYDEKRGFASSSNPYAPINAIALIHMHKDTIVSLCVPPDDGIDWTPELLRQACNDIEQVPQQIKYVICKTERELLITFLEEIYDSDLVCGWNSELFDNPYLAKRLELVLGESGLKQMSFRGSEPAKFETVETQYGPQIKIMTYGRIFADYLPLYKKYEPGERASYKLASIEQEVGLNLPKLTYEGSLAGLYKRDFAFFVRYNIRDVEILRGFEKTLGYVALANQMYHMSCGLFDHVLGTLKLAELSIINYCHYTLKRVVNNTVKVEGESGSVEGAFVLLPQRGMHEWIGSLDVNSLYPSSIMSVNISPETLIGQFTGTVADAQRVAESSDDEITLILDRTRDHITATASEFRELLLAKGWAISGYGTVYDQRKPGIVPSILADWYAQRKHYQKLKKEAEERAKAIKEKYNNNGS